MAREHRDVLLLGGAADPQGIAVMKSEADSLPHGLEGNVLKICTFVVADEFRGTKRGERLFNAVMLYARGKGAHRIYVEVNAAKTELVGWLEKFGFLQLRDRQSASGDLVLWKSLLPTGGEDLPPLEHAIRYGPGSLRISAGHVVPIKSSFHSRLLPEAHPQRTLVGGESCGNAIRKAYICRASTTMVNAGDALLFAHTGTGATYVTSVGVVESTLRTRDVTEVVTFTGVRTVFTKSEIEAQCRAGSVLAILFRLDRILIPPWPIKMLIERRLLKGNPQSITRLKEEGLEWLRVELDALR